MNEPGDMGTRGLIGAALGALKLAEESSGPEAARLSAIVFIATGAEWLETHQGPEAAYHAIQDLADGIAPRCPPKLTWESGR